MNDETCGCRHCSCGRPAFLLLPPVRRLSRRHDTHAHRQHQQFARSPASSVDFDALYLRLGTLAPTSPADTTGPASTSPPMGDFGMDLGQSSASHGQATVNRSRSFSGGTSLLFGERVGDGQLAAQLGLSGRGRHSSTDRCSTLREEDSQLLYKCHVVTPAPKSRCSVRRRLLSTCLRKTPGVETYLYRFEFDCCNAVPLSSQYRLTSELV